MSHLAAYVGIGLMISQTVALGMMITVPHLGLWKRFMVMLMTPVNVGVGAILTLAGWEDWPDLPPGGSVLPMVLVILGTGMALGMMKRYPGR